MHARCWSAKLVADNFVWLGVASGESCRAGGADVRCPDWSGPTNTCLTNTRLTPQTCSTHSAPIPALHDTAAERAYTCSSRHTSLSGSARTWRAAVAAKIAMVKRNNGKTAGEELLSGATERVLKQVRAVA